MRNELSNKEKNILFWASFLALTAAGVGFVFRGMIPTLWEEGFSITKKEVGALTGAALWPIAITMIIFSLLVDKIGYKVSMFFAFLFQAIGITLTVLAKDASAMWWACFCCGLGHGVVEAVINPLCASIYREEKSKWLNILHASWPAGIVLGGIAYITFIGTGPTNEEIAAGAETIKWQGSKWIFWVNLIPVVIYGILFLMCKKFPVDERVEAGVSYKDMLKEFGGLGIGLAATFVIYELAGQKNIQLHSEKIIETLPWFNAGMQKLFFCILIGSIIGSIFGVILKSKGHILFFVLCLIMIPLATAEIATDGWIRTLMAPIIGNTGASWALIFSAGIMMTLRFFAGVPLKFMNPPQLLLLSSVFSIAGLFALSATGGGPLIFVAFIFYAVGQTFYWPTVLGFVSEQFPKGGAMTLNTVTAIGLLTVGIFGFPFLGAVQDHYSAKALYETEPALVEKIKAEKTTYVDTTDPKKPTDVPIYKVENFFGVNYESINSSEFNKLPDITPERQEAIDNTLKTTSQKSLKVAAVLPAIMAIAFLLIILWYKTQGGYKPVQLNEDDYK